MDGTSVGLSTAARIQLRVIYAIVLRETRTRFGQHRLGYLWALIEPSLWIATLGIAMAVGRRAAPLRFDVVDFLLTGILPYILFRETADRVAKAIDGNRALLYFPQVVPLDLALARAILELATGVTVLFVLHGANVLVMRSVPDIESIGTVILGLGLCWLLGTAFGLVLCAVRTAWEAFGRIQSVFMRPLFWTSGLFFTANQLPPEARHYLLFNPVLHGIELVRDGWFPAYEAKYASTSYIALWALALGFLGLAGERLVRGFQDE